MENKIQIKNIFKKYDTFELNNMSFCIPRGYITGFIGKNGAGKTTSIKSILSLINLDDGKIIYEENSMSNIQFLQSVGIVMDEPFLAKDWNMNIVNSVMKIGYDNWNESEFFGYLSSFGIDKTMKVKNLSRGMKIKLMLTIALSHEATTLILDEPTSGLDPSMRDEFTDIMKKFVENENNTVLFSTHITQDLEAIADYIVFIADGKLIDFETKDNFMNKYMVLKGYDEQLTDIPPEIICGKKVNEMGFECLVKADMLNNVGENLIIENSTIDKIIILYGRQN